MALIKCPECGKEVSSVAKTAHFVDILLPKRKAISYKFPLTDIPMF